MDFSFSAPWLRALCFEPPVDRVVSTVTSRARRESHASYFWRQAGLGVLDSIGGTDLPGEPQLIHPRPKARVVW